MKRWILLTAGCALSVACIIWIARMIDLPKTWEAVRAIRWEAWLLAAGIYLLGFLPRGLRWRIMLRPVGNFPLRDTYRSVVVGYAANNVLPFRLGEVLRAGLFARLTGISSVTALFSVAVERIMDGATLAAFLAASLYFLPRASLDRRMNLVILAAALLFTIAVVGGVCALFLGPRLIAIATRLSSRVGVLLERALGAVTFLKSPTALLASLGLSLVIWSCEGMMFVVLAIAMHLQHPFEVGFLTLAVVNLGILLPSAPGYIGIFQIAAVSAFMVLGHSQSEGLAFGVLVHAAQFIPLTLLGLILAGPLWPLLMAQRNQEKTTAQNG